MNQLGISWLSYVYQKVISCGSAGYQLFLSASYHIVISWLLLGYKLVISRRLAGYQLVISWLLAVDPLVIIYGFFHYWVLIRCELYRSHLEQLYIEQLSVS